MHVMTECLHQVITMETEFKSNDHEGAAGYTNMGAIDRGSEVLPFSLLPVSMNHGKPEHLLLRAEPSIMPGREPIE